MHYWESDCVCRNCLNHAFTWKYSVSEGTKLQIPWELLLPAHVIIAITFFFIWVILSYQASKICLTWILAKYAVILRAVGMNCTRDGAVVEHSWSEWKPRRSDFYKIRTSLHSKLHRSTPRSTLLMYSGGFYCLLSDRTTLIRFRHGVSFLMGNAIALLVFNINV